jgi:hypothetical protein
LDEDAIIIVLGVPFAVIEHVTVGFGTAIQSKLVVLRHDQGTASVDVRLRR